MCFGAGDGIDKRLADPRRVTRQAEVPVDLEERKRAPVRCFNRCAIEAAGVDAKHRDFAVEVCMGKAIPVALCEIALRACKRVGFGACRRPDQIAIYVRRQPARVDRGDDVVPNATIDGRAAYDRRRRRWGSALVHRPRQITRRSLVSNKDIVGARAVSALEEVRPRLKRSPLHYCFDRSGALCESKVRRGSESHCEKDSHEM